MDIASDNTEVRKAREAQGGSILDQLKQRRAAMQGEHHLDMDVPGYNGLLVMRLRPVPWDDLKVIAERTEKSRDSRRELLAHADTLIIALDEILVRDEGELRPIDPSGSKVRFDERLAELLDVDATRAREVLFGVFGNDLAVTACHNEFAIWAAKLEPDIQEELKGESRGTRA